jgi:hypothetical protein
MIRGFERSKEKKKRKKTRVGLVEGSGRAKGQGRVSVHPRDAIQPLLTAYLGCTRVGSTQCRTNLCVRFGICFLSNLCPSAPSPELLGDKFACWIRHRHWRVGDDVIPDVTRYYFLPTLAVVARTLLPPCTHSPSPIRHRRCRHCGSSIQLCLRTFLLDNSR